MMRTQIQLPDELYRDVKRIAAEQEMSVAELVRRGLEHMRSLYPQRSGDWQLPEPIDLGEFKAPPEQWRELANLVDD